MTGLDQLRHEMLVGLDDIRELIRTELNREPREFMTTEEVAEFCRVGRREVLRWKETGLPYYPVGKGFRFKAVEVRAFVDRLRTVQS
jgi:excisionase family DNA binding protein